MSSRYNGGGSRKLGQLGRQALLVEFQLVGLGLGAVALGLSGGELVLDVCQLPVQFCQFGSFNRRCCCVRRFRGDKRLRLSQRWAIHGLFVHQARQVKVVLLFLCGLRQRHRHRRSCRHRRRGVAVGQGRPRHAAHLAWRFFWQIKHGLVGQRVFDQPFGDLIVRFVFSRGRRRWRGGRRRRRRRRSHYRGRRRRRWRWWCGHSRRRRRRGRRRRRHKAQPRRGRRWRRRRHKAQPRRGRRGRRRDRAQRLRPRGARRRGRWRRYGGSDRPRPGGAGRRRRRRGGRRGRRNGDRLIDQFAIGAGHIRFVIGQAQLKLAAGKQRVIL